MGDDLHDLLTRVASGEVSPADAADRLRDLPSDDDAPAAPAPPAAARVARVAIRSEGVRLTVVADPTVAEAVALGRHRLRREDGVLHVDTGAAAVDGYAVDGSSTLPRWLAWLPQGGGERVTVRVNPALPVSIDALGSMVEVRGLQGGLTASASGATLIALDVAGPLDIRAVTAKVFVRARLDGGDSTIATELSRVDLRLLPGSDVRVAVDAELGAASILGADVPSSRSADGLRASASHVVGAGTGSVTVTARLGKAEVRLP
jgi:hypothetical protein